MSIATLQGSALKKFLLTAMVENQHAKKFRALVANEAEASSTIAAIKGLGIFEDWVFDIESKSYPEGLCVRVSWEKFRGTPILGSPDGQTFGYRVKAGPFGENIYVADEISKAMGMWHE